MCDPAGSIKQEFEQIIFMKPGLTASTLCLKSLCLALLLVSGPTWTGCSSKVPQASPGAKKYELKGKVVSVD